MAGAVLETALVPSLLMLPLCWTLPPTRTCSTAADSLARGSGSRRSRPPLLRSAQAQCAEHLGTWALGQPGGTGRSGDAIIGARARAQRRRAGSRQPPGARARRRRTQIRLAQLQRTTARLIMLTRERVRGDRAATLRLRGASERSTERRSSALRHDPRLRPTPSKWCCSLTSRAHTRTLCTCVRVWRCGPSTVYGRGEATRLAPLCSYARRGSSLARGATAPPCPPLLVGRATWRGSSLSPFASSRVRRTLCRPLLGRRCFGMHSTRGSRPKFGMPPSAADSAGSRAQSSVRGDRAAALPLHRSSGDGTRGGSARWAP